MADQENLVSQKHNRLSMGNTYALFQIIKYVIWVMAIAILLQRSALKSPYCWPAQAALLVGIGLGLQQTFNDIISGIILLSERSIKIGDILEIDGDIVKIQKIGIRTSQGLNRDEISIIIPNSSITTSKVINWSHRSEKTRFRIQVGVAYGSDVDWCQKSCRKAPWSITGIETSISSPMSTACRPRARRARRTLAGGLRADGGRRRPHPDLLAPALRQKIVLSGALIVEPRVFVLDEPMSGLDPRSAHLLEQAVRAHCAAAAPSFFRPTSWRSPKSSATASPSSIRDESAPAARWTNCAARPANRSPWKRSSWR